MTSTMLEPAVEAPTVSRRVEIDFLYLDLATCDRCIGTDASLEAAMTDIVRLLDAAAIDVSVRKTLVASEAQARDLGFMSSPTLRVDGRDIALELRESPCAAEACACNGGIDCRVWVWQGREYTEAPASMIVDAVLRAVYGGTHDPAPVPATGGDVPQNLKRFFASTAQQQPAENATCCSPSEQATCCEPAAKASCCGDAPTGGCGCQ